jgi:3-oxoacyl-[acyl-carrier-protein] synthase III
MPETSSRTAALPATRRASARAASVGAVGVAVPEEVVKNADVAARLGVSEDWIVARTGVRERRVAGVDTDLIDYAAEAASRALAAGGAEPEDVDLVLVATMSHDSLSPNAAPLVAARIGADRAGAMDVGAACSGFVSALVLGAAQIESGRADCVLVVGADLMTRIVDPTDRATAPLFGDGAGAVLVSSGPGRGEIGPAVLGADGARHELVKADRVEGILRMKGHDTFRQAVDRLEEATAAATAAAGLDLDEIDVFAFHQANTRILTAVGERLDLDPARVIDCMGRYGNTSAATIPLALAEARDAGMLRPGAKVLVAAFGGGLTWAATVIEWGGEGTGGNGRVA